jgi:hypothetical protein
MNVGCAFQSEGVNDGYRLSLNCNPLKSFLPFLLKGFGAQLEPEIFVRRDRDIAEKNSQNHQTRVVIFHLF